MAGNRVTQWLWKTAKNAYKTVDEKLRTHSLRQCPQCGKDVVSLGYQVKRYCNNICYQRYKRARFKKRRAERSCLECNKPFVPKRDNHSRCSNECRKVFQARYLKQNRIKYKKKERHPCRFCSQLFVASHYLVRYCSSKCKREYEASRVIPIRPKIKPVFRDITVDDLNTSKHSDAIAEFKKAGGKVQMFPTIPSPPVPNTGVRMKVAELDAEEWDAKANVADLDEYEDFLKTNN